MKQVNNNIINKNKIFLRKKLNTNANINNGGNIIKNINKNMITNNNKAKVCMYINHNRAKNKSTTINGLTIGLTPKDKENYNYNSINTDKNYATVGAGKK